MEQVTLSRRLLARRRFRLALLAVGALVAVVAVAWGRRPDPVPDAPPRPLGEVRADAQAQVRAAAGERAAPGTPRRQRVAAATLVPDVPLAWRRIAQQAASWPAPGAPRIGAAAELPTLPASRVRDAIGANVDLWRTEYGYADFRKVLQRVRQLHLRHARVGMQSGATHGLTRMQQLGRAGVRLNVVMGDAYGRFGTAPYEALARRLEESVLPYVDAVEGTNEADLTRRDDWATAARTHQQLVARTARATPGRRLGVIAPSVGRLASVPVLGDLAGLADAGNAHAYSSGGEPGLALANWLRGTQPQVPGGPVLVTEAGFQTDVRQRKYHTPTSPEAAAAYVPRTILEALRRGVPQVYLYELIDRWDDPFGIDTAAHFGLLEHDLTPKPAWSSLVRLQRALLDNGRPDRRVEPIRATVLQGPDDLQVLAFRRRDGSAALALWRTVPVWDETTGTDLDVPEQAVRINVPFETQGALATELARGTRTRLRAGRTVGVAVGGAPVIVTGLRPAGS